MIIGSKLLHVCVLLTQVRAVFALAQNRVIGVGCQLLQLLLALTPWGRQICVCVSAAFKLGRRILTNAKASTKKERKKKHGGNWRLSELFTCSVFCARNWRTLRTNSSPEQTKDFSAALGGSGVMLRTIQAKYACKFAWGVVAL